MTISGAFFVLGSFAFVRATHEDPPMKPLFTWYHVQSDELLGSWLFFWGTVPVIPYILLYLAQSHGRFMYWIALLIACVFVFATLLFVRACYPNESVRSAALSVCFDRDVLFPPHILSPFSSSPFVSVVGKHPQVPDYPADHPCALLLLLFARVPRQTSAERLVSGQLDLLLGPLRGLGLVLYAASLRALHSRRIADLYHGLLVGRNGRLHDRVGVLDGGVVSRRRQQRDSFGLGGVVSPGQLDPRVQRRGDEWQQQQQQSQQRVGVPGLAAVVDFPRIGDGDGQ